MPMSDAFSQRLHPILPAIAEHYGTPFHIYDETGIRETGAALNRAFGNITEFQEFFAVKALPNPRMLAIIHDMGFGFDCSSVPELIFARQVGANTDAITFTSNNTTPEEFAKALDDGCILNLDDISHLDHLPAMPDRISFRYNPGNRRSGNVIIGKPEAAKFGITHDQVIPAYTRAKALGATRFGLHTMLVSSELNYEYMLETTVMLLDIARLLQSELSIEIDSINIGGGFGIPYHPDDTPLNLTALGEGITRLLHDFEAEQGFVPALHMENGRYITAPHGVLVTKVINQKHTYRDYIGVDASMSALMRPGIYGAYHHITVHNKADQPTQKFDVVGSLCENNDKFAIQRELPAVENGDLLLVHDTGAHGHAMGFNYNGRLRPQELLLRQDGTVERIRRAETFADYIATLNCNAQPWSAETLSDA
ncbi:MAG: diaminopimelate decarboxylase [Aggregatilineales bacterium]